MTMTTIEINNGFLCCSIVPGKDGADSSDPDKVLLLATTEKLLTILGCQIPKVTETACCRRWPSCPPTRTPPQTLPLRPQQILQPKINPPHRPQKKRRLKAKPRK